MSTVYGSAPHVRGTWGGHNALSMDRRFSPACAGNIQPHAPVAGICPVQPRMCGEHTCFWLAISWLCGSAPHVRGTYPSIIGNSIQSRFSPACAGNIYGELPHSFILPVQPRMCGEHVRGRQLTRRWCGSAPHVRGTSHWISPHTYVIRFSPACAGNIL